MLGKDLCIREGFTETCLNKKSKNHDNLGKQRIHLDVLTSFLAYIYHPYPCVSPVSSFPCLQLIISSLLSVPQAMMVA